uniref:DNA_MISMATCH_REPAIR_2 domain-containing protein n=1 Tax=Panagrellus redivivus TaxID=6233 RepID=A0A7E4ZX16_PANRE
MTEYKNVLPYLKRKAVGTVAIFLRKDNRELFDDDAKLVAEELLMTNVGRNVYQLEDRELTVLSINKGQYNRVIRDLLLIQRRRVEVYEESGKEGFKLVQKGDLKNYDDFSSIVESCVELGELSTVMSVKISGQDGTEDNLVSVVLINPHDMRVTVAEFSDTKNFYYLSELIQNTTPRECFLFKGDSDERPEGYKALLMCMNRANLPSHNIDLPTSNVQALKKQFTSLFFKNDFFEPHVSKNVLAVASALATEMRLLPDYKEKFLLIEYQSAGHLHLDGAAVKALELLSLVNDMDDEPTRGVGTLYDYLNKCRSDPGRRLLRNWLRRPLSDRRQINERLDVVESLIESHGIRTDLSDKLLRQVPDIATIERRLLQKKATLVECYRLYRLIDLSKRFKATASDFYDEHAEEKGAAIKVVMLDPLQEIVNQFEPFMRVIEEFLDMDHVDETGEYRIIPSKDDELNECWKKMQIMEMDAETMMKNFAKKAGLTGLKLELADVGYVFRGTHKDEKSISKQDVQVVDVTKGGGIRFTTREVRKLSSQMEGVRSEYNEHQARLTAEVMEIAQEHTTKLAPLNDILAVIDVLVAFAVVAFHSSNDYVRPELLDKGTGVLELTECRHPVLEEKRSTEYIANDVMLHMRNGDERDTHFAVVTGANMGGKSTYLRSAGLTVIMAQMGCFVPCSKARFSILDSIHTRVGASDYQCNGVSTFMAEMVDCVAILDAAKSTSLVLVDELGRGTSTFDGFGMAWGVAKHILTEIDCFCLFATHYHEMSVLKEHFPERVINLKADTYVDANGDIVLLFKITEGLAERSFGINIAKSVDFPEPIIKDATHILNYLETNTWENAEVLDPLLPEYDEEPLNAAIQEIKRIYFEAEKNKANVSDVCAELLKVIPSNV